MASSDGCGIASVEHLMSDDVFKCSRCGGSFEISLAQSSGHGILTWSAGCRCRTCGLQQEVDGIALPPPDLRSTLLADEGVHELMIAPGAGTISTLRQLQQTLCLPDDVLAPLAGKIPGAVLSGTPYEMQWLAGVLGSRGIPASSAAKDPSGESDSVDLADVVSEDWPDAWVPSDD